MRGPGNPSTPPRGNSYNVDDDYDDTYSGFTDNNSSNQRIHGGERGVVSCSNRNQIDPNNSSPQIPMPQNTSRLNRFIDALAARGLTLKPITGDGNCLFRAVSYLVYGTMKYHRLLRIVAARYMWMKRDYFSQFVATPSVGFASYIESIQKDGVYGDQPELTSLSQIYSRRLEVYQYSDEGGAQLLQFDVGLPTIRNSASNTNIPLRLCFFRGGHYDVLLGADWEDGILRLAPGEVERKVLNEVGGLVNPNRISSSNRNFPGRGIPLNASSSNYVSPPPPTRIESPNHDFSITDDEINFLISDAEEADDHVDRVSELQNVYDRYRDGSSILSDRNNRENPNMNNIGPGRRLDEDSPSGDRSNPNADLVHQNYRSSASTASRPSPTNAVDAGSRSTHGLSDAEFEVRAASLQTNEMNEEEQLQAALAASLATPSAAIARNRFLDEGWGVNRSNGQGPETLDVGGDNLAGVSDYTLTEDEELQRVLKLSADEFNQKRGRVMNNDGFNRNVSRSGNGRIDAGDSNDLFDSELQRALYLSTQQK